MKKYLLSLVACSALFLSPKVFAEGKISGLVFGDFFWKNLSSINRANEGDTGFWIRRGYLTYDHTFDEKWSSRFRLEINSPDLTATTANMTPYVKEASLTWKPTSHSIQIGMIPTPTWVGLVEDHWGYRSVEKTPLDLQRFGSAVDLGIAVKGTFGEGDRYGYHVMGGNGSATRSETNGDKKFFAAFFAKPIADLVFQIYGDAESGSNFDDRYTLYTFTGYSKENWRAGLFFAERIQQRRAAVNQYFEILSGYGAFKIVEKWWGFLRADRLFDASPNGNQIEYLPFNRSSEPTLLLAGLDYEVHKDIHLMPNVEAIIYDPVTGRRPGTDLMSKLTFFWKF